ENKEISVMFSTLLSRYTSRSFLKCFGTIVLGVCLIIVLFEFAEIQRQSGLKDIESSVKLSMVLLRVPHLLEKALPFLIFISALFIFWRMNRSSELVIFRATGISLWRLILPISLTALFIGCLELTVFNSLSSMMLTRYEHLEKKYLSKTTEEINIEPTGVWLSEHVGHHQVIERINAKIAYIREGYLDLKDGWDMPAGKGPQYFSQKSIETSLTQTKIKKMKLIKRNIYSFWKLPAYISLLDSSGLKSLKHQMYWHSLLANSVWFGAMIYLAAAFSCRPRAYGKTIIRLLIGLSCGFLLYVFKDIMFSLGVSGKLSPLIAAWLPPLLTLMVGSALVFNQEDG
ncbi:MAG: LptF/LptG family permease, partial [Chlamydiota bacterium]